MAVFTILAYVLSIVIVVCLISLIIVPAPVKMIINRKFVNPIYPELKTTNETIKKNGYILYKSSKNNTKLIVIFTGGAFMFSSTDTILGTMNYLYELIDKDDKRYDIVAFSYPTRFSSTIKETMLHINKILSEVMIPYNEFHAVGVSAGCLLAGTFIRKEQNNLGSEAVKMQVPKIGLQFSSFSGASGIYDTRFNSELLTKIFQFYIMRKTPALGNYTCYGITIPKLILTASSDFLYAQSSRFIQRETCEYYIYKNTRLPHAFTQLINLWEARDSIERIYEFIKKAEVK